jgi:hypothetical protein
MYIRARIKPCNGGKEFDDVVLVDAGATGIMTDESLVEELGLKTFGRVKIAALGATVEDVEIGPRRVLVCSFPEEVKERLKLMGFSEKVILGVSAIEDAGCVPDTEKGVLWKIVFLVL